MSAHLQSFHDRMVEIAFAHGRLRMHRAEFANLLRRGPEAIVRDTDFYLDCNCSGATADLEGIA